MLAGIVGLATVAFVIASGWLPNRQENQPKPDVHADGGDARKNDSDSGPVEENPEAWITEELADVALETLKQIGKQLSEERALSDAASRTFADKRFASARLRPVKLDEAYSDSVVTVFRAPDETAAIPVHTGLNGLSQTMAEFSAPFADSSNIEFHFKIDRVEESNEKVTTRVLVHSSGRSARRFIQQNAIWNCVWQKSEDSPSMLKLLQISSLEYEEVVRLGQSSTLFSDCTESVFRDAPTFDQQMAFGVSHWKSRLQSHYEADMYGHQGIAVGDANGDGLDDLYVCQPSGLPNRLYLQNLDGTVRDDSQTARVDWLGNSLSALFVDLDNDGDQDLALTIETNLVLMENNGNGTFTERVVVSSGTGALTACDYDLDGDLDLYVANYGIGAVKTLTSGRERREAPKPYHDADNGGRNVLYRNDGGWQFSDATIESGLDKNNQKFSFAAGWEDFDNDGDSDLYVANDFGRNNLYRNDNGSFTDIAAEVGVEDIAGGMSVSWADFNHDGWMDLYVGNMYSSAGGRIATQKRFQSSASDDIRAQYRRHARGNTLFSNVDGRRFEDASLDAAVTMGRWAWSSRFVDLNNDGYEDIVVANGYITGPKLDDL